MAFLDTSYNVNDMPEGSNFEPLPPGWYDVTIKDADLCETQTRTGKYIKIKYGLENGRVVFGSLNIRNQNPQAEMIGRQQLGDIMRATGLANLNDTDQLIGLSLSIKLDIQPARTDERTGKHYDASNDVKAFKPRSGAQSPQAMPAQQFAQPQAAASATPTASKTPPWARGK